MTDRRSSTKRVVARVTGIVYVVALFAVGIAYACGYFDPDPRLDEVHALQAKLMAGHSLASRQGVIGVDDANDCIQRQVFLRVSARSKVGHGPLKSPGEDTWLRFCRA